MVYSLALRLTEGGKNEFFLSQTQLAQYFGWDVKTVRSAFRALRDAGMLRLLRGGRGGDGRANLANIYQVLTHSKLASTGKYLCWLLPDAEAEPSRGEDGREHLPKTGRSPLPETGILVSEESTNESTNPSQSAGLQLVAPSIKTNPKSELTEDFCPDASNERYAKKNGLDLKEELAAFSDFHRSIGNERRNWQAVFRTHLVNAALHRGRISVPDWIPPKEWNEYLAMREQIAKGATQAAQTIAVRILGELREKGESVSAVLNQSTRNEWTGIFALGHGPRGQRAPWETTGSLTENFMEMRRRHERDPQPLP
jgi:hypothetical protein